MVLSTVSGKLEALGKWFQTTSEVEVKAGCGADGPGGERAM